MKRIINFILMLAVFYVGSRLFPEIIAFQNTGSLVLTTLFVWVIASLINLVAAVLLLEAMRLDRTWISVVCLIVGIVVMAISLALAILFVNAHYAGFTWNGSGLNLWILVAFLWLFSIGDRKKKIQED